jgi:hypothetical protein
MEKLSRKRPCREQGAGYDRFLCHDYAHFMTPIS